MAFGSAFFYGCASMKELFDPRNDSFYLHLRTSVMVSIAQIHCHHESFIISEKSKSEKSMIPRNEVSATCAIPESCCCHILRYML